MERAASEKGTADVAPRLHNGGRRLRSSWLTPPGCTEAGGAACSPVEPGSPEGKRPRLFSSTFVISPVHLSMSVDIGRCSRE
ncbi:unnamed protein product [Spirodela intermedia]|uniref:Uncharacterized protein n=1 Tax=Spirodela intermedia TaxID=51605 RepID=A0A7I8IYL2_SPIIN|nr:unnamed protein product [Spirodela intermedia]CAA6663064.1 unnamed protein product [Spirodela intermedia]